MAEDEWKPGRGNQYTWDLSYHIKESNKWFPGEVFRFYYKENPPRVLAFVSVLLDDRHGTYDSFKEPLITAGWFDCKKKDPDLISTIMNKQLDYGHPRIHAYIKNNKNDGSIMEVNRDKSQFNFKGSPKFKFEKVSTFALPLVSISDAKDIKTKIIDPLISGIRKKQPQV